MNTQKIININILLISTIAFFLSINCSNSQVQTVKKSNDEFGTIKIYKSELKSTCEIIIKYNKTDNKISSVEKNGKLISENEFSEYQNELLTLINLTTTENSEITKNEQIAEFGYEKLYKKKYLKTLICINETLKQNGYLTQGKSFQIKFKNIFWEFNFSDKIYLDKKQLPEEITEKLLLIYSDIMGTKYRNECIEWSLPDGIESEIKYLTAINK